MKVTSVSHVFPPPTSTITHLMIMIIKKNTHLGGVTPSNGLGPLGAAQHNPLGREGRPGEAGTL